MAIDYNNLGLTLSRMGNNKEALEYYNKAIITRYVNMNRSQDVLVCLHKALEILEEFKKETNYHHPLLDDVNNRISYLRRD